MTDVNAQVYTPAPVSSAPVGRASLVAACIVVAIVLVQQVTVQFLPTIMREYALSSSSVTFLLLPFTLSITILSIVALVLGLMAQRNPDQRVLGAAGAAVGVAFLVTAVFSFISPLVAAVVLR